MSIVGAKYKFFFKTKKSAKKSKKLSPRRKIRTVTSCSTRSKKTCGGDPNCNWRRNLGCVRRKGVVSGDNVFQGPVMPAEMMMAFRSRKASKRSRKSAKKSRKASKRARKSAKKSRKASKRSRKTSASRK